jgi:hypothetical protein
MAGVIVVRNGVIAKGHGTLAAIRQLWDAGHVVTLPPDSTGHREPLPDRTAPVIDASGWSEAQFKAFVIADNRLGESEWDMDILKIEFEELDGLGFDLDLTGFDLGELEGLMVPEMVDDGIEGEDDVGEEESDDLSDTMFSFGQYRFSCDRNKYLQWQEELRQSVGFDNKSAENEIKRRIGL